VDPISIWLRIHTPLTRIRAAGTERGASLVEYAFLVGLIALVCVVAVSFVGSGTKVPLNTVGSSLSAP
jgi:pilus assembly protein Flp/PilA